MHLCGSHLHPHERHSFPYHKKRVRQSAHLNFCSSQACISTHWGFPFLLKGHTTFPKPDLCNWTWGAIFVDFLLSYYPIPLIFLSAFWLCWLTFFFQNFKNWNTFEHPYLLPPFVSTPLKQNSRNLSDVYNIIGSFYSLCPKICVTKYSLSHLAFLEIFKIKVINDFHFDYIYMKISYVIYYIFIH